MVKYGDYLHYNVRITVCLILLTLILVVMPLVPEYLPLDQGAVLQSSIYGFANMFSSPRYTQATMVGQAINGIAVSAMRMTLKYTAGDSEDALYASSKLFFASGWIFMTVVSLPPYRKW